MRAHALFPRIFDCFWGFFSLVYTQFIEVFRCSDNRKWASKIIISKMHLKYVSAVTSLRPSRTLWPVSPEASPDGARWINAKRGRLHHVTGGGAGPEVGVCLSADARINRPTPSSASDADSGRKTASPMLPSRGNTAE